MVSTPPLPALIAPQLSPDQSLMRARSPKLNWQIDEKASTDRTVVLFLNWPKAAGSMVSTEPIRERARNLHRPDELPLQSFLRPKRAGPLSASPSHWVICLRMSQRVECGCRAADPVGYQVSDLTTSFPRSRRRRPRANYRKRACGALRDGCGLYIASEALFL